MTLFAARGFPVGRQLEEVFERAFVAIGKMAPNPKFSGQPETPQDQGPHPAELMLQAKDQDTKLQIARETNAMKAAEFTADQKLEIAKLAAAAIKDHNQQIIDIEKNEIDRERNKLQARKAEQQGAERLT